MLDDSQMEIIWKVAKKAKNQGELAVFNRINDSPRLQNNFGATELNILKFCAGECKRQRSGEMSVYNLIEAWMDAISFYEMGNKLNLEMIEEFGKRVEPIKNKGGFRSIRIGVGNGIEWIEKAPPDRVVPQLTALLYSLNHHLLWAPPHDDGWGEYNNSNPISQSVEDEFYFRYEEIHPFADGNGRTGKIIYNYLKGTLLDPQMPPDFYGGIANP